MICQEGFRSLTYDTICQEGFLLPSYDMPSFANIGITCEKGLLLPTYDMLGRRSAGYGEPAAGHLCDGEPGPAEQVRAEGKRCHPHRGRGHLQGSH